MNQIGPDLEILTHRLVETPREFLLEARIGTSGTVHVAALVNDLLKMHGARASLEALSRFQGQDLKTGRNRLALVMIAAWLLADDWFFAAHFAQTALLKVLDVAVTELAAATPAHKFVHDPDRREELVRVTLARLDFRPAGETLAQATDRLSGISATERQRLLEASRASEERARAIRETLTRKAAEESADKWSRE